MSNRFSDHAGYLLACIDADLAEAIAAHQAGDTARVAILTRRLARRLAQLLEMLAD